MSKKIESGDLYPNLYLHPFTGVTSRQPGFSLDNRHNSQDLTAKALASKYGQKRESLTMRYWNNCLPPPASLSLASAADTVRQALLARFASLDPNSRLETIYQLLTLPSEIPFLGNERTIPSWEPLNCLFQELDSKFDTTFHKDFRDLGETYPQSGIVNRRIKFLVETALILSKAVTGKFPPLPFPADIIPNVWGDHTQFDAILVPPDTSTIRANDPQKPWETGPWAAVEAKADFRDRSIIGSRIEKAPFRRHIIEMQEKLVRIAVSSGDNFRFPESIVFIYLRGTKEHVVHCLRLDYQFLTDWREGILTSLGNNYIPQDQINKAGQFIKILEKQILSLQRQALPDYTIATQPSLL